MPIRVRDKGKDFVPAPDGLQRAVCCDVVELGLVDGPFGKKRKVRIVWQSEHLMEDNKPFLLMKAYGATLHKKGNLRGDLESWRGKPLSDKEADDFDLEVLLGKNCQVLVVQNTKDGQTYSNVNTVVPPVKGAFSLVVRDYTRKQNRPDWKEPDTGESTERASGDEETQVDVDDVPF